MFRATLFFLFLADSCTWFSPNPSYAEPPGVDIYDTVIASGAYLDYWLATDNTVMITWGTPQEGRIGALPSEKWPGWAPHFYKYNFENYIGLRYSCGSPCWTLTLLPKNKSDTITTLMEDLCVDTNRGYVFGNRCITEENCDFCLYNVNSGKHQPITLPGLEWTGDIMTVLDSCAFVDAGLFLRWSSHINDQGLRDTIIDL